MPKLFIDNEEVDVPAGSTVLEAAAQLGIHIPTLCHLPGKEATTSCMACLVKIGGRDGLVPSCATAALDGMRVESETDEVHHARRTALELLLADHLGDCLAPCHVACPAGMDIPLMIRQIASGDLPAAIRTVKQDIPLPAVLGRICPAPCEKACRRSFADGALSICLLKRYAADVDLASQETYLPQRAAPLGKRVVIAGAGPAGLSAAYYLLSAGCAVTVLERASATGGKLRTDIDEDRLPRSVLDAEVAVVATLGAEFRCRVRVGKDVALRDLQAEFDAVLLAVGELNAASAGQLGAPYRERGLAAHRNTYATEIPGVFAAGGAVRASKLAVRAVADGKSAAACIVQHLTGGGALGAPRPFSTHVGRPGADELPAFLVEGSDAARVEPTGGPGAGLSDDEARMEATRCLHCDCRKPNTCKLRIYAQQHGARPSRYRLPRRPFHQDATHPDVLYEPGKCIDCGICVRIASEADEELGLTFVGRGFDVRIQAPFGASIAEALRRTASRCAEACPTGALVLKNAP